MGGKKGIGVTFAGGRKGGGEKMGGELVKRGCILRKEEEMKEGLVMGEMRGDGKKVCVKLWEKMKVGLN